ETVVEQVQEPDGCMTVTQTERVTTTKKVTLRRNWTAYTKAQTEEKERFMELLNDLCITLPQPIQGRGRPRMPLSEMVFSSVFKVYTGFSARRNTTDLATAQERGYLTKVPSFATVNNYLADERITEVLRDFITASALPLRTLEQNFAADSTGFR